MEQFQRWLERGKNDPLPEYYGTGKNCPECGVFLWDTKSYVKHMKRNHGFKVKDGKLVGICQNVLKNERREEQRELERRNAGETNMQDGRSEEEMFDALVQSSSRGPSASSRALLSMTLPKTGSDIENYLLSDSELDDDTEDSAGGDFKDFNKTS